MAGPGQPKIWEGPNNFDFKRATAFCLGHRLLKHKTTKYARNFERSMAPFPPLTTPMVGDKPDEILTNNPVSSFPNPIQLFEAGHAPTSSDLWIRFTEVRDRSRFLQKNIRNWT